MRRKPAALASVIPRYSERFVTEGTLSAMVPYKCGDHVQQSAELLR